MIAAARRRKIVEFINQSEQASILELSTFFSVSDMTIRRDLDILHTEGKVTRTHGGAIKLPEHAELNYEEKAVLHESEKRAIARQSLLHISDGMSIILDAGSTVAYMVEELDVFRNLSVFTTDLHTAWILAQADRFTTFNVYCTGGAVTRGVYSLDGHYAERMLQNTMVDVAFLGCDAVCLQKGAMSWSPAKASVKQYEMRAARRSILLADSSKFGRTAMSSIDRLEQFDVIVTDSELDDYELRKLREAQISIEVAQRDDPAEAVAADA